MNTEELVKYQEEAYKEVVAKYLFTAEGGGADPVKSNEKKAKKKGITLHFFRYGYINKKSKDDFVIKLNKGTPSTPNDVKVSNAGIPELDKFYLARTFLNPGYLYLIDKKNNGKYKEWEIDENGLLKSVVWKEGNNGDVRKSSGKSTTSITVKNGSEYYIAYSPVQWSRAYFDNINASDEKKEKHMQVINCEGINKSDSNNNDEIVSYDKVNVIYHKGHTQRHSFNKTLKSIDADEKKQDEKGDNDIFEDMFITLHDPVGIALEHSYSLKSLWNEMNYLMISLKIGVSTEKIKAALKEKKDPKSLQDSKKLEQIEALYNIAVNINSVAFSNEDNIDKIGNQIDAKRLKFILATKERLALKNKIEESRTIFINYLESDYFTTAKQCYLENTNEIISYAKYKFATLINDLWKPPNYMDSFLETKKEASKWNANTKKGKDFIIKVLKGKTFLGEVFTKNTLLDEVDQKANYLKYVIIIDAVFEMAKGVVEDGDQVLEAWVKVLNSTRLKIDGKVHQAAFELTELGKEFRKTDIGRSKFVKNILNINKKSIKQFKKASGKFEKGLSELMEAKQLTFTRTFEKAIENDILSGMHDIKANPRWTKLMKNLSFLNLGLATLALRKADNDYQYGLNIGKFVHAIADAHVQVRNVKALKIVDTEILEAFKITTSKIATGVGYADALINAAEAGLNFWERDYDAAIAYSTSAVAAGLATYILGAGVVNGWNPVGWGLLILGAAVGFYAAYLEDSPLERIAKNGVFGKSASVTFTGNYIAQILQHISPETRDALHKAGFTDWEDYTEQYKILMDILVGSSIVLKIVDDYVGDEQSAGSYFDHSKVTIKTYYIKKIQVSTYFGGYLTDEESLEYQIFYLPKGLGTQAIEVTKKLAQSTIAINTSKDQPPKAEWEVDFNSLEYTKSAQILIMTRVNINNSEYFPIPNGTTPRYVAAIIPIIRTDYSAEGGRYYNNGVTDRIFIGTQQELINKTIWR